MGISDYSQMQKIDYNLKNRIYSRKGAKTAK